MIAFLLSLGIAVSLEVAEPIRVDFESYGGALRERSSESFVYASTDAKDLRL